MNRRDRFLPPYIPTRRIAMLLAILLLVSAAVAALSAGFEISQIRLFAGAGGSAEITEAERWLHTFIRNALLTTRLLLAAMIAAAFLAWLHRARVNARAFGCRRFRYSRIWTIIGFLIPIWNLFRPYQIVSEVWRASDPRAVETPTAWITMPLSRFVTAWWATLLATVFLEILAAGLANGSGSSSGELLAARSVGVLAGITYASSAILAYLVVSGITGMQAEKWAVVCAADAEAAAADPCPIDLAMDPEPPALEPRSIWKASTADT